MVMFLAFIGSFIGSMSSIFILALMVKRLQAKKLETIKNTFRIESED